MKKTSPFHPSIKLVFALSQALREDKQTKHQFMIWENAKELRFDYDNGNLRTLLEAKLIKTPLARLSYLLGAAKRYQFSQTAIDGRGYSTITNEPVNVRTINTTVRNYLYTQLGNQGLNTRADIIEIFRQADSEISTPTQS